MFRRYYGGLTPVLPSSDSRSSSRPLACVRRFSESTTVAIIYLTFRAFGTFRRDFGFRRSLASLSPFAVPRDDRKQRWFVFVAARNRSDIQYTVVYDYIEMFYYVSVWYMVRYVAISSLDFNRVLKIYCSSAVVCVCVFCIFSNRIHTHTHTHTNV